MSILDKLLSVNVAEFETPQEATFKSKQLAKALGQRDAVEITVKELPVRRCKQMISDQFNKKGDFDFERNQRAQARLVADGVKDPDLRDARLREHFGCETPADLAEKLFGFEVTKISDLILSLSGFESGDEDEAEKEQEELKND
ncbi:MAG: hypothetical protein IKN72_06330 [Clostridia bacterium]|nr:hypothetical protein [Clostridia bacterium]